MRERDLNNPCLFQKSTVGVDEDPISCNESPDSLGKILISAPSPSVYRLHCVTYCTVFWFETSSALG